MSENSENSICHTLSDRYQMGLNKPKYGPLYWLNDISQRKTDWLLKGWNALDCAAIFGDGAKINQKYPDYLTQERIKWKHYSHRIKFLDSEDYKKAREYLMDWEQFSGYVRFSLIDTAVEEKIVIPAKRKGLISWTKTTLKALGSTLTEERLLLREPSSLLKFAYTNLNAIRPDRFFRSIRTINCLILIGIASDGAIQKKLCAFCFRWTSPAQTLCFLHGQGQANNGTRSEKARNYYIASKASQLQPWGELLPIPSIYKNTTSHGLRLLHSIYIVHILWASIPKIEAILFKKIRQELKRSPLVTAYLGNIGNIKNSTLENLLREKLDPLELWPEAWPDKIRFAEKWMIAEATMNPGRRGPSKKTDNRIAKAENLAQSGKNITEIAETLGITRTAIVKWCSRGRSSILKTLLSKR